MCYYDHAVAMMMELDRWKRISGAAPHHHHEAGFGQNLPRARKKGREFELGRSSVVASVVAASAILWVAIV